MIQIYKNTGISNLQKSGLGPSNKYRKYRIHRNFLMKGQTSQESQQQESNIKLQNDSIITFEEVVELASSRDLEVYVRRLGPFYRVICRDKPQPTYQQSTNNNNQEKIQEEKNNSDSNNEILALSTGFIIPFTNILHGERLEVLSQEEKGSSSKKGGYLGLGFWLGMALYSYAYQLGCRKLEILSINDYDYQAERLIKYYAFFDFKFVKKVEGGTLSDLFDMLLWGGVGTRMDADIEKTLIKWGPILRRQKVRSQKRLQQ
eukprot:TRINITY_DN12723_c0_g1_i3.p1 TRINITY_DN12723_c0_g1~~TRINITY_DN12723_c0_g1_i3.p1  ORF type:complete len:260 (-),score=28.27 TRINITY_DN12723_c0_g1_i3:63-842(-)